MILEKEETNQAETRHNDIDSETDLMICTTPSKRNMNISSSQLMDLHSITKKSTGPTAALLAAVAASEADRSRSTYHR